MNKEPRQGEKDLNPKWKDPESPVGVIGSCMMTSLHIIPLIARLPTK